MARTEPLLLLASPQMHPCYHCHMSVLPSYVSVTCTKRGPLFSQNYKGTPIQGCLFVPGAHTDTKLPSRALGRHSREACLVLRMAIGTDPGAGSWLVAPGLSVDSHMTAEARSLASSGRHLLLHLHTCQYYIWGFPHPILDTAHGGPP